MGSHQQGADQRFKQVSSTIRRSKDDWEELACRLLLSVPEWCDMLKGFQGNHIWQSRDFQIGGKKMMGMLQIVGTCEVSTFVTAVRSALIRMSQREKEKIRDQRNRTE